MAFVTIWIYPETSAREKFEFCLFQVASTPNSLASIKDPSLKFIISKTACPLGYFSFVTAKINFGVGLIESVGLNLIAYMLVNPEFVKAFDQYT